MKYRIQVDIKKYNKAMGFDAYPPTYTVDHQSLPRTRNPTSSFQVGDVVRITVGKGYKDCYDTLGVVLGQIDPNCRDLRTDAEGMRSFDELKHATVNDILTATAVAHCGEVEGSLRYVSPKLLAYLTK